MKAFIVNLYYKGRVTEHKIKSILEEAGISISEGEISNILTKEKQSNFIKEKQDIFEVGMDHSEYIHADDSGARHKGINHHVHVVCNKLFTAFFITRFKNKKEIRQILGLKENKQLNKPLITDDAKQYYYLATSHALCWIHEIRPYRKLNPFLDSHRKKLNHFLAELWKFYGMLKEYKKNPDEKQKEFLERKFDEMFSTETGYKDLDRRIELTKKQKEKLLLVLTRPKIPLHNNPAEISLREMVIKRKISGGTRSENGKIAWENMMSIMDTCRKMKVNFFDYVKDIFSGEHKMTKLSDLIVQRSLQNSLYY
ncbi:MAG: transposase, partial [Campylobacterales bacterium]|nr:transposase [Campylobacterales bacterium]